MCLLHGARHIRSTIYSNRYYNFKPLLTVLTGLPCLDPCLALTPAHTNTLQSRAVELATSLPRNPFPFSSVTKTRNQKLSPRGWSRRESGSYVIMTSRRAIAASCPSSSGTYWRSEEWGTGCGAGGLESTQP